MCYQEIQPCLPLYGRIDRGATSLHLHLLSKQECLTHVGAGDRLIRQMFSFSFRNQKWQNYTILPAALLTDTTVQGKIHWGWRPSLRPMTGHGASTWQSLVSLLWIRGLFIVNALKPKCARKTFTPFCRKSSLKIPMIWFTMAWGGMVLEKGSWGVVQLFLSKEVVIRGLDALPTSLPLRRRGYQGRCRVCKKGRTTFVCSVCRDENPSIDLCLFRVQSWKSEHTRRMVVLHEERESVLCHSHDWVPWS